MNHSRTPSNRIIFRFGTIASMALIALCFVLIMPAECWAKVTYSFRGRITVGIDHQPLKGVKVQAAGNLLDSRTTGWQRWDDATAFTNDDGYFTITASKRRYNYKRRVRIYIRLENGRIAVRDYLGDTVANYRPIAESKDKTTQTSYDFGTINISTRPIDEEYDAKYVHTKWVRDTLKDNENCVARAYMFDILTRVHDLMKTYSAEARAAELTLEGTLRFNGLKKLIAYFPVPGGLSEGGWRSYAIGNTINIHKNDITDTDTWIHELGHVWLSQHNHGIWTCDLGKHHDMCPSGAFNEGFAEYFSEMAGELIMGPLAAEWLDLAPHVYELTKEGFNSLNEMERDMDGVNLILRLMTYPQLYEDHRRLHTAPSVIQECQDPSISFREILRVMLPGPGWPTNWKVGKAKYGIWHFTKRARDILPQLDETYRKLAIARANPQVSDSEFLELVGESCPHRRTVPQDRDSPDGNGSPSPEILVEGLPPGSVQAPAQADQDTTVTRYTYTTKSSTKEQPIEESDDQPPTPPGEGYVLTSHGWIKGEQPPDEATTDDSEELAVDRTKAVADDKDIPMETDPVTDDEEPHADGTGSAGGCSIILGSPNNQFRSRS